MRPALGSLAMICATAIAIAFLKYWIPFMQFKMHFDQQQEILELLGNAARQPQPAHAPPRMNKISYIGPDLSPWPPAHPHPQDPDSPPNEDR